MLSAITWGVSWPPGYPLYTFLAHFFSMLPLGTPESLVDGFSGLCHAATAAVFFLTLRRLKVGAPAAALATALMAFSPLYWYYSEVAEVRALNDLLAIGAAYCAIGWTQERKTNWLYALAAVLGLGISHHPTYVLILPAIAFWLWRERAIPTVKKAAPTLAIVVGGCALPYVILGIHLHTSEPIYNPMGVASWDDVLALFLRKNLGGPLRMVGGKGFFDLGGFHLEPLIAQAGWLARGLLSEPNAFGLGLAIAGAASLWRRDRRQLAFWTIWIAGSLAAFLFISSQQLHLHDPEYARAIAVRFYLMPFLGLFAIIGAGAQQAAELAGNRQAAAAFVVLALAQISINRTDLSAHQPLLDYGRDIIDSSGPDDVIFLASDDTVLVANYLDYVKHETGGRIFLNPVLFAFKPYVAELKRRYPQLNMPEPTQAGLPLDYRLWVKLNPGRRFYSEALFLTIMQKEFKAVSGHGALIALTDKPDPDERGGAERYLTDSRLSRLKRQDLYAFTQELYLARTDAVLLALYATELDAEKDAALLERLHQRFTGL